MKSNYQINNHNNNEEGNSYQAEIMSRNLEQLVNENYFSCFISDQMQVEQPTNPFQKKLFDKNLRRSAISCDNYYEFNTNNNLNYQKQRNNMKKQNKLNLIRTSNNENQMKASNKENQIKNNNKENNKNKIRSQNQSKNINKQNQTKRKKRISIQDRQQYQQSNSQSRQQQQQYQQQLHQQQQQYHSQSTRFSLIDPLRSHPSSRPNNSNLQTSPIAPFKSQISSIISHFRLQLNYLEQKMFDKIDEYQQQYNQKKITEQIKQRQIKFMIENLDKILGFMIGGCLSLQEEIIGDGEERNIVIGDEEQEQEDENKNNEQQEQNDRFRIQNMKLNRLQGQNHLIQRPYYQQVNKSSFFYNNSNNKGRMIKRINIKQSSTQQDHNNSDQNNSNILNKNDGNTKITTTKERQRSKSQLELFRQQNSKNKTTKKNNKLKPAINNKNIKINNKNIKQHHGNCKQSQQRSEQHNYKSIYQSVLQERQNRINKMKKRMI